MARGWLTSGPVERPETGPPCHHPGSDAPCVQGLGQTPARCWIPGRSQNQTWQASVAPPLSESKKNTERSPWLSSSVCALDLSSRWVFRATPRRGMSTEMINRCPSSRPARTRSTKSTEPDNRRHTPVGMSVAKNKDVAFHVIKSFLGLKYR